MKENYETGIKECFKYPDILKEGGEFDRVAETFGIEASVLMFQAQSGELVELGDDVWDKLENTDANTFEAGDWDAVHAHSNPNGEKKRDWEELRDKIDSGTVLDAPIIMKFGDRYHLVSGNTRLMVSKAKGISPKVLIFEVDIQTPSDIIEQTV
jgi:hypothetical protein